MSVNTTWSHCEGVIRRFEAAWRRAERPDLHAFVTPGGDHSTRLLTELAHVDLEFRLRAGEPARVEDYIARFPDLAARDVVLDLIVTEYGLRHRAGPSPEPDEYFRRFPELRADIAELLAAGVANETRSPGRLLAVPVGVPVVAGCEVGEELGRGGMGVVYKAFQPALGRTVAVKTLAAADTETADRFRREAETVAQLDHPNIVPVYEVGTWVDQGRTVPYFVMKWYPGGSLDAAPCGPGTDVTRHARTVEAVARAVHHAHRRGILHRDLKPSNILLDDAGHPYVTDFGLAGRFDPSTPNAPAHSVVGTPSYMAPEAAHAPARVTTAADVYGLGAVLYHLLTGRPPFQAATPLATLDLLGSEDPKRPSAINPAVPRDLEAICRKCLRKDPEQRYPSAEAVAKDLERWLTGLPVAARPGSMGERTWRWMRRSPLQAALSILTAVAVVATTVSLVVGSVVVSQKERETADALTREKKASWDLGETLEREQEALYLERVSSAGRLYTTNQLSQAWRMLDESSCHEHGWEWEFLNSLRRTAPAPIGEHSEWVKGADFLSDGRLATSSLKGEVAIWDLDRKQRLRSWIVGPMAGPISAHPSRPWFAVFDGGDVIVWSADTGEPVHRFPNARWAVFAPAGDVIAVGNGSRTQLFDTANWKQKKEFVGHEKLVLTGAFSPDGKLLATSSEDRTVRVWDIAAGTVVGTPRPRPEEVRKLKFTANGAALIEDRANGIVVTDAANGMTLTSILPEDGRRPGLAVSPNPQFVAINGPGNDVQVWDIESHQLAWTFRGHTGPPNALVFSRDGRRLVSGGGEGAVRVWNLEQPPECGLLPQCMAPVAGIAVAPGGRYVAVAPSLYNSKRSMADAPIREPGVGREVLQKPGDVQVFDREAGREVLRVAGCSDVAYSPDGSWFVAGQRDGVTVYQADTGSVIWSTSASGKATVRVAVEQDGRRIAAADLTGAVRVWDAATGKELANWPEPRGPIYGLVFASGGRLVAAGMSGCVSWDLATNAVAWTSQPEAMSAAVSPDGKQIATVERAHRVHIRKADTGEIVRVFVDGPADSRWLAFSPDGRRLVTGGIRMVRVWNVETGHELLSLPGAGAKTVAVAWEGPRVYALDDRVRIWMGADK